MQHLEHELQAHEADPHNRGSALSDIILGGQDGLVNVLGVLLGVAKASDDPRLVLVAGLAAALAESVSMAAVAYTSQLAEGELYESERRREHRHVATAPNLERQEVRDLYAKKGFEDPLLSQIVDTITANPDVWVAVMMSEEHGLRPVTRADALKSAFVVGTSALVGSLLPLAPFMLLSVQAAMFASIGFSALVLFGAGFVKARMTVGSPARSGFELAVIGTVSALIGYAVGAVLGASAS